MANFLQKVSILSFLEHCIEVVIPSNEKFIVAIYL